MMRVQVDVEALEIPFEAFRQAGAEEVGFRVHGPLSETMVLLNRTIALYSPVSTPEDAPKSFQRPIGFNELIMLIIPYAYRPVAL